MTKSRRNVRLLIAATVFVNCAPWLVYRLCGSPYVWPEHEPDHVWYQPDWVALSFEGIRGMIPYYFQAFGVLTRAQVHLFAIWTAFGSKPLSWRFAYLLACLGLLTRMHISDPTVPAWVAAKYWILRYLIGYGFCVASCLLLCRLAGVRLAIPVDRSEGNQSAPLPKKTQFTLRYLLWWTAGLAVFLGLWPWMILRDETLFWLKCWPREIGMYSSAAIMALAALWLALGTRHLVLRASLLCLAVVGASCWQSDFCGCTWDFTLAHVAGGLAMRVPTALWVTATLLVFRAGGYRLNWRARSLL